MKIEVEVDLQWLSRAGTGSGRVWKWRRLGWVERSQQRKHTGGRRAGRPSTSPPTSRTHCAYCTKAAHTHTQSVLQVNSMLESWDVLWQSDSVHANLKESESLMLLNATRAPKYLPSQSKYRTVWHTCLDSLWYLLILTISFVVPLQWGILEETWTDA